MLETVRPDITLMGTDAQLEFFQNYCERRALDLLKPSTYNPGVKKKKKVSKKKSPKKGKAITLTKLKQLDATTLDLLQKAGIEL